MIYNIIKIESRCVFMELTKKLKIAMLETNVNQIELADRTNQSQSNLSKKMMTDNFKLSEYERLVTALGCQLEINIVLPNGKII